MESCCASTPALMGLSNVSSPPKKQKTWSHEATNYFPKSDIQPGNKSHRAMCTKVCQLLCYRPTTWTFALPVVPSASTLVASAGAISRKDRGAIFLLRSLEKWRDGRASLGGWAIHWPGKRDIKTSQNLYILYLYKSSTIHMQTCKYVNGNSKVILCSQFCWSVWGYRWYDSWPYYKPLCSPYDKAKCKSGTQRKLIIEGMPRRISRRIFDSMGYHKYGKGSLGMGGYEGVNRATRLYYHAFWLVEHFWSIHTQII